MMHVDFEKVVDEAFGELPDAIRDRIENLAVVIEDFPDKEVMRSMGIRNRYDLLGLYQGVSLDHRGFYYGNVMPDRIALYRKPIEALCRTRKELVRKIRDVLIHEIGHYFGFDDDELYELMDE